MTRSQKIKSSKSRGKFHIDYKNPSQKMAWAAFDLHDVIFLSGPAGVGKAQPLDAVVYTPKGAKKMGDIQVGNEVCAPDGRTAKVIAVHPQGTKPIYRVIFNNGDFVECCLDHLWKVDSPNRGWFGKVVDTQYLLENYKSPSGRGNLHIETPICVFFEDKPVPIDPYVLGILIGGGCLCGGSLQFFSADEDVVLEVTNLLRECYQCVSCDKKYTYTITNDDSSGQKTHISNGRKINYYISELKSLGLWGTRSWEKHIPNDYIYNSEKVRKSLIQGLLDSNGTVMKSGQVSFTTTSKRLAEQFSSLVASLGGIVSIKPMIKKYKYNGEIRIGRTAYRCHVISDYAPELFRLKRKKAKARPRTRNSVCRVVTSVELVGNKKAQCITVDSPEGLYLTDSFVITHNSHLAIAFAIYEVLQKNKSRIVLTRPIVESGERLGFLPGDFYEKVNPYMAPMYDCVRRIVGNEGPQRDVINTSLEVCPLAYMRGNTFDDAVCIFDEAQNASMLQLKMFLTRFGEGSKVIVTGDPKQSDISGNSAFTDVMQRLESVQGIAVVRFGPDSIVRHPLVARILDRLEE